MKGLGAVIRSLEDGFRAVGRNWGLVVLLLVVNLLLAAALAAPLAGILESELKHRDAATAMMYGFDHDWWSEWHERQRGWTATFSPEIFGIGFVYRNLELLLEGALPAALFFAREDAGAEGAVGPPLDPLILALGGLYLLVQVFLTGGLLGVLRAPQGGWTARGLLHGSGFYFGRLLRLALVSLVALWMVFRLYRPLAGWVDGRAREAVSESTAMAWLLGRYALLLLVILFLNMVAGYAKVMIVLEERASAILAFVSSLSFCLRNLPRAFGHYMAIAFGAAALLVVWGLFDRTWTTIGYKTQLVTLLVGEAFVFGRLFLRTALLGGQVALYRRSV